ncbi:Ribonuclease H-like superfamily [Sesbania bispinosa]|nr:Ribonuclease H-like superfamily [Sesbania bispinosa]
MDNEAALRIDKSKAKVVSLPSVGEGNIGADPKKRKTSGALENAFNMQARETLDFEIARMFYSAGLPFHLARNPHFKRAFSYAANNSIGGYQPPGYNKLRTSLLLNERKHVENLLEPIKHSWSQKGVTIVSDGWSDPQRRPLINFMAVTESGPMFLKAVDCSDEVKDRDFIAKHLTDIIMEETLLDDVWWDKVDYILAFTSPIYNVLRKADTEASCLHLVYEMWDSMIEEVRKIIYRNEKKVESAESDFYNVVHTILIDRWTKSSTPLHCLAHSLNPRYFVDAEVRRQVNVEFANFTDGREGFDDIDSLSDIDSHGAHAPILQKVALKLLGQPCSSSCSGDGFDSLDEFGILEVANLSLDEPELEVMFFNDDQEGDERR